MNKLLLSLLALSLWACSQEKMEDLQNPDEQPKQALAQGKITVDGSSPRNLELKKLYERERLKQEKLRTLNGAFSQYNPLNSLIKSVLDRNMFILNGSTYQIGNKDKSGQTGYLYTNARGVVLIGNSFYQGDEGDENQGEVYGILDFVNGLPEKKISILNLLQNYRVLGL